VLGPYSLVRLLGRGGMGAVWEAVDFRLDRRVALKVSTGDPSPDAIERFRREATHSARLRHPQIVSVHDVGFDQGQQYLVMDLVEGITLGEALRSGRLTYRRKSEILELVARAVHYAHSQGVIHRDLKPSNIMLESRRAMPGASASSVGTNAFRAAQDGEFGQPLVMDFGLAKDVGGDSSLSRSGFAIGTPSYMPPEQAEGRLDAIGPRSDVWSLGAILYEMLTGRPPFTGESTMGVLRAVMNDEPVPPRRISRDVPRDLETICLTCLQKDPARRYASASVLADDLHAWLAGDSISARPATVLERSVKLVKRHRLAAVVVALVMPTLVTFALLYGEHLKELAAWQTITSETFTDDGWQDRWRTVCGGFDRRDGRLVSQTWHGNIIAWKKKLIGPVAIDYDAEMLPGSPPCDISLIWAKGIKQAAPAGDFAGYYTTLFDRPIELKIGAFDGAYSAILIDGQHVGYADFKPLPGVRYHVRVEIIDNRITLAVDGRTICSYVDPFPVTGGYACIFGYYPGKAFGAVRIQTLSVPQKVSATAIGDAFAQEGSWQQAAEQYARVATAYPGTALAREALYKQGLCSWRGGERDQAFATWGPLSGTDYDELVALHRLDVPAADADLDRLLPELEALYRRATRETRVRVAVQWASYVDHDGGHETRERVKRLLEVHDRVFPDQTIVDNAAAECLLQLHRFDELLARYPHQRRNCAMALLNLNRDLEVADSYTDQRAMCAVARFRCGMFDRLSELGPQGLDLLPQQLIEQARYDDLIKAFPTNSLVGCALINQGRLAEVETQKQWVWYVDAARIFAGHPERVTSDTGRIAAMLVERRFNEVLADRACGPGVRDLVTQCGALQAAAAGRSAAIEPSTAVDLGVLTNVEFVIDQRVVIPAAQELLGVHGAFARAEADIVAHQRYLALQGVWYASGLASGRLTEAAFLEQPRRRYAPANRWLFSAIAEDLAGHAATACERYRAYLATKGWERGDWPQVLREMFAQWRIGALAPR
jgi:hypothetical protein